MNSDFEELKKVYVRERLRSPSLPHISKIKDQKAFIYLRKDYLRLFLSFIATIAALIYVDYTSSKVVETSFTGFYILLCCSIYSAILNFYLFNKLNLL